VKASLSTPCPHCGHAIAPAELRRVDFEQVRCPRCKQAFIPGKPKGYLTR
jgi:phage FluMu protein Com